jgi:hypothetical protein
MLPALTTMADPPIHDIGATRMTTAIVTVTITRAISDVEDMSEDEIVEAFKQDAIEGIERGNFDEEIAITERIED